MGKFGTWKSKKQTVVSRGSAKAKFMSHEICEGMWLKRLLNKLIIQDEKLLHMFCDNQATISIAKNPVHHDRTKHVEIDRHFIKEKLENGVIMLQYAPTKCQIADILTKALPRSNFEYLNTKLGMINIYYQAWEGECWKSRFYSPTVFYFSFSSTFLI